MLESVFISIFMFGIVLNLLGWLLNKPIFVAVSLMTWLSLIITNSLYIEVPGDTTYMELGLQAFCWLFIFIDILYLAVALLSNKKFTDFFRGDWRG